MEKPLKALRGAVCAANTREAIAAGTVKLYDELLSRNKLAEADILSLLFSLTPDLDALNPAAALRQQGRAEETAMMVFQEAAVTGSLPGIIRLIVHCRLSAPARHVYLDGAETLRPDWSDQ
ncbi:chorismate mutase [Spirochaetia bacterium]|nr:chorismate mutase [Spirochaetia bacterium]